MFELIAFLNLGLEPFKTFYNFFLEPLFKSQLELPLPSGC
jgi:hypothetical protein